MDIKMSYANSRYTGYTEKDIFSEYDEDEGDMDDDVASEHNELAQRIANATNRYSTSAYNWIADHNQKCQNSQNILSPKRIVDPV